ncbi:MAG: hypothetical protein WD025_06160 [Bacteriovoracaceae bacterium]
METIRFHLLTIVLLILFMTMALSWRHKKQHPELALNWAKNFWLAYIGINWLALPFYFYFFTTLNAVTIPLSILSACYWFRLPFEILMRKMFKNWKAIHSIIHDSFSFMFFSAVSLFFVEIYQFIESFYLVSIGFSLLLNIYWNYSRRQAPEKKQNRMIFYANAALYTIMFCFIYLY